MSQLQDDQLHVLDTEKQPVAAVDPRTGQVYRPIKQEVHDVVRGILTPYNRGWDESDEDELIRKHAGSEVTSSKWIGRLATCPARSASRPSSSRLISATA